jgi:GH15 family glucan-1,4-alpha-glucosidase
MRQRRLAGTGPGIWEARGQPQPYVSSTLMCWVAPDRAAKLAAIRGDPDQSATWGATADEIHADILANGASGRGMLRQHHRTDALDASTLLAPMFGFLPGDDEHVRNTVLATADELTEHGFVLHYRTDETVTACRARRDLPDLLVLAGVGAGDRRR